MTEYLPFFYRKTTRRVNSFIHSVYFSMNAILFNESTIHVISQPLSCAKDTKGFLLLLTEDREISELNF